MMVRVMVRAMIQIMIQISNPTSITMHNMLSGRRPGCVKFAAPFAIEIGQTLKIATTGCFSAYTWDQGG